MNLSELKVGQGKVDVLVTIKSKAEPRMFEKYGRPLKVCNAIVSDDSGEMSLTLWNDDIDKFNEGDQLKITNGYVSEFNGTKQLSAGKFGKIEKAGEEDKGEKSEKKNVKEVKEVEF